MKHLLLLGIVFSALHFSLSQLQDFCTMEHDAGDGSGTEMRFYYSLPDDRCIPFKYTGQGGNENRFLLEKDCMRNCSSNVDSVYPIDERNACLLVKTPGVCKGHLLRYHYDATHEKCKKFFWTGCGGNGNRFHTPETCAAICSGVKREGRNLGDNAEPEDPEPDTNVGAIVAGVLSVVLVGVLAVLIALAVKSKKKKSKKTKGKRDKTEAPLTDQGIEMS